MQFYLVRITLLVLCGSYSDVYSKLVAIVQSVAIYGSYNMSVLFAYGRIPILSGISACISTSVRFGSLEYVGIVCVCRNVASFFFFPWA